MSAQKNISVGIHGIGVHLPDEVRTNDWWPDHVVRGWKQQIAERMSSPRSSPSGPGEQRIRRALEAMGEDPFAGSFQRRVLGQDERVSDMEVAAARQALARAECGPDDIDLLLVSALVPDFLLTNYACTVQHELGISTRCFVSTVDGSCNSFSHQLAIAEAMLRSGQASKALLVQSCALSRVLPSDEAHSAWFGDGATAVVVGPVESGRGILGRADGCQGAFQRAVVGGIPGKHWYDEGKTVVYNADRDAARAMIKQVADTAKEAIDEALERASYKHHEVDFYACHQGLSWQRAVTQAYAGLERARSLDTFPMTGNISSANVPLILEMAAREGLLRDDHLVVTLTTGSGMVWSSMVLRWGR